MLYHRLECMILYIACGFYVVFQFIGILFQFNIVASIELPCILATVDYSACSLNLLYARQPCDTCSLTPIFSICFCWFYDYFHERPQNFSRRIKTTHRKKTKTFDAPVFNIFDKFCKQRSRERKNIRVFCMKTGYDVIVFIYTCKPLRAPMISCLWCCLTFACCWPGQSLVLHSAPYTEIITWTYYNKRFFAFANCLESIIFAYLIIFTSYTLDKILSSMFCVLLMVYCAYSMTLFPFIFNLYAWYKDDSKIKSEQTSDFSSSEC